jgi:hypothetical protein
MQRALAVREAVLGPQHPATQSSQHSLAAMQRTVKRRQSNSTTDS